MSDFESRARRAADAVSQQVGETKIDLDAGARGAKHAALRHRSMKMTSWVAIIVAAVMIGIVVDNGGGTGPQVAINNGESPFELASALKAFDSCDQLLDYFKEKAPDYLAGNAYGGGYLMGREAVIASPGVADDSAPPQATVGANGLKETSQQVSQTNVQEAGVDEPDTIKSDGRRIITVTNDLETGKGTVSLLELENGKPVLRKTLTDVAADKVLLSQDRLLVFGRADQIDDPSHPDLGRTERSSAALYDITNMASSKLISRLDFDGSAVDARMVGSEVRLVTKSQPRIAVPYVQMPLSPQDAKLKMKASVDSTTIDQWLPRYTLEDGEGKEMKGQLTTCGTTAVPETFSGLDVVAVSTFDIAEGLKAGKGLGVVAGGETVYATAHSLYIAQTDYQAGAVANKTHLHKFGTDDEGETSYLASGEVDGMLLNQYSMSEYKDVLRVASTWTHGGGRFSNAITEGVVTTLAEDGNTLAQSGRLAELGREDNESIKSVRFIEDKGYVVTFRQTDPLFVIDLHDAAQPKLVGELKIPGYSGYLHPLPNNRLIGVGQSGAGEVQFSLFDVSDSTQPKRLATQGYPSGSATAEYDPKAFLYWQPRNLVIAPVTMYYPNYENSVALVQVGKDTLTDKGRVAQPGQQSPVETYSGEANSSSIAPSTPDGRKPYISQPNPIITRSLVINDSLFTLSDVQLMQSNLDTLEQVSIVSFVR